ncbi:MAG TPA: hypothetical protein VMI92_10510 [Steroidobacteraceae bacterium]|nr:hypothetical protein [Steroidobacteraceae bacterium]
MRRTAVYLAVVAVLVVSLLAGWVAADWPRWCVDLQWCLPGFPR